MERLASWINRLNERVGRCVSWLTLGLVLLVFTNVSLRYVFNLPLAWSKELEWHLFALIFLFGAGYSLRHDRHVRVDLFYEKADKADQRRINFWGTLIFLIPWCLVLIYSGWNAAVDAWKMGERSPEAAGLPNLWLIQFALPLGIGLLLLQGIAELIRSRTDVSE
ncbi:TRAP transporter small permease subunit [Lewinella cohaerens]|uniref:TRAP transporter small permease subunit n=1 Tax=Lewinella cohaerens TaxID=70995 RepID=UPI000372A5F7|nr:TRAP transporter small permease subunit [Lewinella cohaerens]